MGDKRSGLAAEAVIPEAAFRRALQDGARAPAIPGRGGDRDLIDHPAGAADALQGVGAEDQLHPVDEEGVDGEAVARSVAQGRGLGNAVDREERRTAAQGLALTGELLARRRKGRRERGHRIDKRARNLELAIKPRPVDHLGGQRQGGDRQRRARSGYDDGVGLVISRRRRGVLGMNGGGEREEGGEDEQRQAHGSKVPENHSQKYF